MEFVDGPRTFVPMGDIKKGDVYRIYSRNLSFGVYDGDGGFIGIRYKFGDRFLFTEYHWDTGAPYGTVKPMEKVGEIPEDIGLQAVLGTQCSRCERPVDFDCAVENPRGWFYTDTGEKSIHLMDKEGTVPVREPNTRLFDFLEEVQRHHEPFEEG